MRMTSTTQTGIPLANQSNRAEDILDLRGVRKRRSVLRRPRRRNIDLVQKRPQREGIPLLHTGVRTQQTEVLLDHSYRSFPCDELLQKDNISRAAANVSSKGEAHIFRSTLILLQRSAMSALLLLAFSVLQTRRFYDLFFTVWRS